MHQIRCPWCGIRDEIEYRYRGEALAGRPEPGAGPEAFHDFVYARTNPKGWHVEWWHHVSGCRQLVKVVRNTLTHEIAATGTPSDGLEVPGL